MNVTVSLQRDIPQRVKGRVTQDMLIAISCGAVEVDSLGLQPEVSDHNISQSSGGATLLEPAPYVAAPQLEAFGVIRTCGSRHRLSPTDAPRRITWSEKNLLCCVEEQAETANRRRCLKEPPTNGTC